MSNLLALDCTDRACSVAVRHGEEVCEIYLDEQRLHAKRLLGLIQDCLQRNGLDKSDLDAVVWARGPGSFTGLRIAAACVQGLCFGLQIPAVGISSLLALALRARDVSASSRQRVWVGIDAKMGEIYSASFAMDFVEQEYSPIEEERLLPADGFKVPPGFDTYLGSALGLSGVRVNGQRAFANTQIHAADMLSLPAAYLPRSANAHDIEPVYLRRADAWKKMGVS